MGALPSGPASLPIITDTELITGSVIDRMNVATDFVLQAYNTGLDAINALANENFDLDWDEPVWDPVATPGTDNMSLSTPGKPTVNAISVGSVQFLGVTPAYESIDIDSLVIPAYTDKDYGFNIPDSPDVVWPTFSKDAPQVGNVDIPTIPDYDLPAVPTLQSISIPAPPDYTIPAFDGVLPVADLTEPALSFEWSESYYSSDLQTLLKTTLLAGITNGGSGLDEATEQAIYDRAISRHEEEEQTLLDSISTGLAARGFPLPPGALVTAVSEAENKILRSRTDLNNDILVQQSKLAQENTHFILDLAKKFEDSLISYHSDSQNRALDASKFVITTATAIYSLKIEGYKAKLQAYAILADVYKVRIEAEIAKAEFYKAQISAVEASVRVQGLMIEAYKAQVQSVMALMEVYKTQMQGASIAASIDKLKIDGYLGEVQAYSTRTQAVAYRYEGYKAQISGEVAKADMHRADAQAYTAMVGGYEARSRVDIARAEVQLNNTKSQAIVYSAMVDKYKADISKVVAEAEIAAKQDGVEIEAYKAEVTKFAAEIDAVVRTYYGKVEEVKAKADLSAKTADTAVRALLGEYELSVEAAKGVAQAAGQMAAAAASSVNASIHAASSESRSDSRSVAVTQNSNWQDTSSWSYQY